MNHEELYWICGLFNLPRWMWWSVTAEIVILDITDKPELGSSLVECVMKCDYGRTKPQGQAARVCFFFLQHCIGFAIHQHASTMGVHVFPILNPPPPPSPYHPSGSSQCTSPKLPVSCIEPGLVICFLYDIIHVSMPFSQIIPPSLSPTESKRLFYTSVSLLLSCIQGYHSVQFSHSVVSDSLRPHES